jgi:histidine ammonia-lyase
LICVTRLFFDLDRRLAELRRDAPGVDSSRAVVERALASDGTFYGINTGFGALARERIDDDQVEQLQLNLVMSHAVGVGPLVPKPIARLMLQLKIHALALGHSGVSRETFDRLLLFAERDVIPAMPSKGSLGASGDLAPLAHMALPLIGRGFFWGGGKDDDDDDDELGTGTSRQSPRSRITHHESRITDYGLRILPAADVLEAHNLAPITLHAKDGLALINGTQLMSAYGAYVLERALRLVTTADVLAAMSLEALQGSATPFDERIHDIRPHPGQKAVAANVRRLLADSEILESHRACGKVQDPYSLRCIPQVHGASRDALTHATEVVEREINSVTDNPLVFGEGEPAIVSGGNFHGQPLALALDYAAMALAELASISERRTYLLLEGHDGLPPFLMRQTGINSGFMMPQYTAAQLVSENKVFCHPASVDSIPSSRGQEDHVSMGSISATKLLQVLENVETVLGIELLCAAQALDFRKPLRPGRGVEVAHAFVREHVAHREVDAEFGDDMAACARVIREAELLGPLWREIGELA